MSQLILNAKQLSEIGFIKRRYKTKTTYEIPCLNGCFYFNVREERYVWYHKTIIGEASNHIHLDITNKPILFLILSAFNVKYKMII